MFSVSVILSKVTVRSWSFYVKCSTCLHCCCRTSHSSQRCHHATDQ